MEVTGDSVVPFLPPSLFYPGLYHSLSWIHAHHAATAGLENPFLSLPGLPPPPTPSSSRLMPPNSVPNVISCPSPALEAAKTLASIQYQKQVSSQVTNGAKSSLLDAEHPLMNGLFGLLEKHGVDRDLRDQILAEVKNIIDQVESNVRSSLLGGRKGSLMTSSSSPSASSSSSSSSTSSLINNNNNNNSHNHHHNNLLSSLKLAQRT